MHSTRHLYAPNIKRLVDLVDRGPEDDDFYPASTNETVFRREWPTHHNATPEVVEIGYQGTAAWGGKITVPLRQKESGDLISWVAIRLYPRSWLGPDMEAKIDSGSWEYQDPSGVWMWAASLATIAIAEVEFTINGVTIDKWPGEWMDVWSRLALDAGRSPVWDADIYGQLPVWALRSAGRPAWSTIHPTEDGYIYCWLPLALLKRPQSAFPLVAMNEQADVRLNITFRPFSEVVRMRHIPRSNPHQVPLGIPVTLLDKSGPTPIPYVFTTPTTVPGFEDVTVLVGVTQLEDPLRSAYMRQPMELMYEPVTYRYFDMRNSTADQVVGNKVLQNIDLSSLNGPLKEIVFFLRRKAVWRYNEWTNYGLLMDGDLWASQLLNPNARLPNQRPLLFDATLYGGSAIFRYEIEKWWRIESAQEHRGGVRGARGMLYGFAFGAGKDWTVDKLQPLQTFNASRAPLALDLNVTPPPAILGAPDSCEQDSGRAWDIHVFAIGINWLRIVNGLAQPLFQE
jgi:hypothetical protein